MAGEAGLARADPAVVRETDAFVDGLAAKPVQQQKQIVGEKLSVCGVD